MNTTAAPTAASTTISLQFIPIPQGVADRARSTMRDDFGHILHIQSEQAPCRSCLRIPTSPEDLILLSYQPLRDRNPYAEVGPIFVHARDCRPYEPLDTFPEDFAPRELILRAYNNAGEISNAVIAAPGRTPALAAHLLSDPNVDEVHVRHTSYTCYDFKIARWRQTRAVNCPHSI